MTRPSLLSALLPIVAFAAFPACSGVDGTRRVKDPSLLTEEQRKEQAAQEQRDFNAVLSEMVIVGHRTVVVEDPDEVAVWLVLRCRAASVRVVLDTDNLTSSGSHNGGPDGHAKVQGISLRPKVGDLAVITLVDLKCLAGLERKAIGFMLVLSLVVSEEPLE